MSLNGLELPRVRGIMVSVGPALPVADLPSQQGIGSAEAGGFVPVPVVPEEC
jgi:hypothetical protein